MLVFDASPVHRWVDCFGPDKTGPNVCAIARVCCTTDRPLINRGGELLVNIVSKIECLLALATLGHTGLVLFAYTLRQNTLASPYSRRESILQVNMQMAWVV